MGNLGLIFVNDTQNELLLGDKLVTTKYVAIVIDKKVIEGTLFIGTLPSLDFSKLTCFYLTKDFCLKDFFLLDKKKIKYSKISLSDKKMLDYTYLTTWFGPSRYKQLRQLLLLDDKTYSEKDILKRVSQILTHF